MLHYEYSPLSAKGHSIRLLRLHSSAIAEAEIACHIKEYPFESDRGASRLYEALSYVWGPPADTKSITLGSKALEVTKNLHAALLQLRDPFIDRFLWVDAICIHQKDDKEKFQQIQHMYQVYSRANRVLVWLGDAADDSSQAFDDIRIAAEDQVPVDLDAKRQFAASKLLQRPWFERMWVSDAINNTRQEY
jgi:hypothetical protein